MFSKKIKRLRRELELSQKEFAAKLGLTNKTVCYWETDRSIPTKGNIMLMCEILGIDKNYFYDELAIPEVKKVDKINTTSSCDKCQNAYEIPYLQHDKLKNIIERKNITSIFLDKELIDDIWGINPDNLRIMCMPSEAMSGGKYIFKRNDVLIIDTSVHSINSRGIYAYTADHDNIISVSYVSPMMGEGLEFTYTNENYQPKTYSKEFLAQQKFTVLGRVIKNISFRM